MNSTIKIITGPAGTGKTYQACKHAIRSLHAKKFKKLVITRPAVCADEELGYLPGDLDDKMKPWTIPVMDYLNEFSTKKDMQYFLNNDMIEICPLAYMRGRTFNDTYIIADEMQNSTINQFKMLATRIGHNSYMTITGDINQTDIDENGLEDFTSLLKHKNKCYLNIQHIQLNNQHIQRDDLVKDILDVYSSD